MKNNIITQTHADGCVNRSVAGVFGGGRRNPAVRSGTLGSDRAMPVGRSFVRRCWIYDGEQERRNNDGANIKKQLNALMRHEGICIKASFYGVLYRFNRTEGQEYRWLEVCL